MAASATKIILTDVRGTNATSLTPEVFCQYHSYLDHLGGNSDATFSITAYVSLGSVTGTVQLYNLTDESVIETFTFNSQDFATQTSDITLPDNKILELRAYISDANELLTISSAELIIV